MLPFILVLFFIFMLLFPDIVFQGASTGITLWFQTVFPTLFPFFIINALLLKTGTIYHFSAVLSPLFRPMFGISSYSSYAVLCGFFCGTPIGAKVITSLVTEKRIHKEEGNYLLSFCNNTSPGFIVGFLFEQSLSIPELAYISLGILYLSSVLSSFLFRFMYYPDMKHLSDSVFQSKEASDFTTGLDESIWESMETILKIGGYIILFCTVLAVLDSLPIKGFFWECIFLPFLELTNGVRLISAQPLSFQTRYILLMALSSFGGICAAFQTKCVIQRAELSFLRYIKEKLITSMVTSFLSFIFIYFYIHFWS